MDRQKALEKAKEKYDKTLLEIDLAWEFYEKVKDHLPKGWTAHFDNLCGDLEIVKYEKANALEFRVVCGIVDEILKSYNGKLRRIGMGGKDNFTLVAYSTIHPQSKEKPRCSIDVDVRLGNPEGCKVEYKRTWKTKVVVSEGCLGIREKKAEVRHER